MVTATFKVRLRVALKLCCMPWLLSLPLPGSPLHCQIKPKHTHYFASFIFTMHLFPVRRWLNCQPTCLRIHCQSELLSRHPYCCLLLFHPFSPITAKFWVPVSVGVLQICSVFQVTSWWCLWMGSQWEIMFFSLHCSTAPTGLLGHLHGEGALRTAHSKLREKRKKTKSKYKFDKFNQISSTFGYHKNQGFKDWVISFPKKEPHRLGGSCLFWGGVNYCGRC